MAVVLTLVQTKQIRRNIYIYIYITETIQKNSKYKYTQPKHPHTYTPTHYKPHIYTHPHIVKQVKTTAVQDTHQMKLSQHSKVPTV